MEVLSMILPVVFALGFPLTFDPPVPSAGTEAAPPSRPRLEARFADIARSAQGVLGVAVIGLEDGFVAAYRGEERFPMASVFKLPLALTVLNLADKGALRLDETVAVKETDLRAGGIESINRRFRPGLTLTLKDLVELTITESDNTAADLLLARIGTPAVNARLAELGIQGVDVSRTERELAVDSVGLAPPEEPVTLAQFDRLVRAVPAKERRKARDRWEADPRDTASPLAMAKLLVRLQKGELASKASTDFVLDAMRRCKTGQNRIRAGVPAGTLVADKTGTAERSANDVGIVTTKRGARFAVAIFVKSSRLPQARRERLIAQAAGAAVSP